jgi:uncharacterized protein (TIGR02271 family)
MSEEPEQPVVIPVIEEELVAGREKVPTGTVRVSKKVEQVRQTAIAPAIHETVEVKRVPVNRVIESMPQMRTEGDVVIIPVVEEELVIQKRLVLKEEVHVRRRRTVHKVAKEAIINREHAIVQRLDTDGNVIAGDGGAAKRD